MNNLTIQRLCRNAARRQNYFTTKADILKTESHSWKHDRVNPRLKADRIHRVPKDNLDALKLKHELFIAKCKREIPPIKDLMFVVGIIFMIYKVYPSKYEQENELAK